MPLPDVPSVRWGRGSRLPAVWPPRAGGNVQRAPGSSCTVQIAASLSADAAHESGAAGAVRGWWSRRPACRRRTRLRREPRRSPWPPGALRPPTRTSGSGAGPACTSSPRSSSTAASRPRPARSAWRLPSVDHLRHPRHAVAVRVTSRALELNQCVRRWEVLQKLPRETSAPPTTSSMVIAGRTLFGTDPHGCA